MANQKEIQPAPTSGSNSARVCVAENPVNKFCVLGVGLAIIDYIATIDHYPSPDEKMRSQSLECTGGGNCYNGLATISSMGISTQIVTKIGADPHGKKVLELCLARNIDTKYVVIDENMNTGFSFIMADVAQGTRTIVYNPGNELDVENTIHSDLLHAIDLVYLDGRFTKAALKIANLSQAVTPSVPLLLDCERVRGADFEELRRHVHYVVASQNYLKEFVDGSSTADVEVRALERLIAASPCARWAAATLGTRGALSLQRRVPPDTADRPLWPGLDTAIAATQPITLTVLIEGGAIGTGTAAHSTDKIQAFLAGATQTYRWGQYAVQYCPAVPVDTAGVGAGDRFIAGLAVGILLKRDLPLLDAPPFLSLASLVAAAGLASIALDWPNILKLAS